MGKFSKDMKEGILEDYRDMLQSEEKKPEEIEKAKKKKKNDDFKLAQLHSWGCGW
jgi:hypothetical protein